MPYKKSIYLTIIGYRRHLSLLHLLADHVIIKELCYCNNSQAQDEMWEEAEAKKINLDQIMET